MDDGQDTGAVRLEHPALNMRFPATTDDVKDQIEAATAFGTTPGTPMI